MLMYQIGAYLLHDSRWGARVFIPPHTSDGRNFSSAEWLQFKVYFPTKESALAYARGYLSSLGVIQSSLIEVV